MERDFPRLMRMRISRRTGLKILALGAAAAIIPMGCGGDKNRAASETPEPTDTVKILKDKDDFPTTLNFPDGQIINLDSKAIREVRDRAISERESQVFTMIDYDDVSNSIISSAEHPTLETLPQDIVSGEDLLKRGIEIVQPDSTKLYVKQAALEEGGPLAAFNNTGKRLVIAVLDDYYVSRRAMADGRYAKVPTPTVIEAKDMYSPGEVRVANVAKVNKNLETDRKSFHRALEANGDASFEDRIVFADKAELERVSKISDRDDVVKYFSEMPFGESDFAGLYMSASEYTNDLAVIYVAVGRAKFAQNTFVVGFNYKGEFITQNVNRGTLDFRPFAGQSYPSEDQFKRNPNASPDEPKSYPYGAQSAGQILLHELEHDRLIAQQKDPNYGEYPADQGAMDEIKAARKKWVDSDRKDNSGYYFVWEAVPAGSGYILTRAKTSKAVQNRA